MKRIYVIWLLIGLGECVYFFMPDMDMKSWVGKHKSAHPYTKEEQDMLKMAYKAAGARWVDLNHGDMDSEEAPGGNTKSPVKGFRGYPR